MDVTSCMLTCLCFQTFAVLAWCFCDKAGFRSSGTVIKMCQANEFTTSSTSNVLYLDTVGGLPDKTGYCRCIFYHGQPHRIPTYINVQGTPHNLNNFNVGTYAFRTFGQVMLNLLTGTTFRFIKNSVRDDSPMCVQIFDKNETANLQYPFRVICEDEVVQTIPVTMQAAPPTPTKRGNSLTSLSVSTRTTSEGAAAPPVSTPNGSATSPPSSKGSNTSDNTGLIIGVIVAVVTVGVALAFLYRKRHSIYRIHVVTNGRADKDCSYRKNAGHAADSAADTTAGTVSLPQQESAGTKEQQRGGVSVPTTFTDDAYYIDLSNDDIVDEEGYVDVDGQGNDADNPDQMSCQERPEMAVPNDESYTYVNVEEDKGMTCGNTRSSYVYGKIKGTPDTDSSNEKHYQNNILEART